MFSISLQERVGRAPDIYLRAEEVLQALTANIACMPPGPGRWEVCEMDRRINLEFLMAIVLLGEEIEKDSIILKKYVCSLVITVLSA